MGKNSGNYIETKINQADQHFSSAISRMSGELYDSALDEIKRCKTVLKDVFEVEPSEEIRYRMLKANLLEYKATILMNTEYTFPKYYNACKLAVEALEFAKNLPDDFEGHNKENKRYYMAMFKNIAKKVRNKIDVHEERADDVSKRKGHKIVCENQYISGEKRITEDKWHEIVDEYVALDMAESCSGTDSKLYRRAEERLQELLFEN